MYNLISKATSPSKPLQRHLNEREELFKNVLGLPLDVKRDLVDKLLWSLPRNEIIRLNEQLNGILQKDIIGSLPPELSILILSKLDLGDVLNCGLVCKAWRCIVEEQSLWALLCASSSPPIRPSQPTWSDIQTTRSILSQPKISHSSEGDEEEEEEYDDRFGYGYIESSNGNGHRSNLDPLGLGMKSGLRKNVWERNSSTEHDGTLPIYLHPQLALNNISSLEKVGERQDKHKGTFSPIQSHLPIPSTKPQTNYKHLYIIHQIINRRLTTLRPIHQYNTFNLDKDKSVFVPKPLTIDMITSVKNGGLPGHSEAIYSISLINHEMKFDLNMNCIECHQPTPTSSNSFSLSPGPLMPGQKIPTRTSTPTTIKGKEWLLTGSRDKTLRLWYIGMNGSAMGPRVIRIFQGGHSGSVLTHCVVKVPMPIDIQATTSPTKGIEGINLNGSRSPKKNREKYKLMAVSGGSDGKICLWDIEDQNQDASSSVNPEKMVQGHKDSVLCVRANDNYVVSCSKDKTIKLFDIHTLEEKLVIGGSGSGLESDDQSHKGAVNAVGLTEDYIISASGDKTIRIWSIHTGQLLFVKEAHSRGIASIDFSFEPTSCEPLLEKGERWKGSLVTGASDASIKVFHLIERRLDSIMDVNLDSTLSEADGDGDGDRKIEDSMDIDTTSSNDTSSKVQYPQRTPINGKLVYLKEDHTMWSPCVCPPGLGVSRPNLGDTDSHSFERCRRCGNRGHTELVRTVHIGERVVISGSYDSKVKAWNRQSGQHLINLSDSHTGRIFSVTSDKSKIISTGLDCRINIWNFAYGLDTSFVEP
ncbi:hypothetical protein L486_02761 [Kwoniella mangroviensis CBS 10435]|uniref:F-box domain-containing protein n=1 Tax=Kwoniella mangroviensis CBS 10435 TaxID=1331196 RepID=A0A1B9IX31_9TREE|nr:hypothetical protein L486_02761 [Kwoniella mangroviensis CBS 10435]